MLCTRTVDQPEDMEHDAHGSAGTASSFRCERPRLALPLVTEFSWRFRPQRWRWSGMRPAASAAERWLTMKILGVSLKDPLIMGHPLHALLTDLPIGALTLGVTCDALGLVTRRPTWRFAARAAHTGALLSGVAAGLVGLWDYQAVPREHPARRVGALHGYLNAAMLGMLLASVLARGESHDSTVSDGRPRLIACAFSAAALATLVASGWLGGDLVFRLGWRVVPAEYAEQLESSLRARGDVSLIEQAHDTVRQYEQEHALLP